MRSFRVVVGAIVVSVLAFGLAGCDSTGSDAEAVAQSLAELPAVVSVSGSGQGMNLNTDAQSEVFVAVEPAASSDQLQAITQAWFEASSGLPNTSLRVGLPSQTATDSELVIFRDAASESELGSQVDAWFALAEAYPRASTVYNGSAMSYLLSDEATPAGIGSLVDDLRASGVDETMSWWFYSAEPSDSSRFSDGQSFTMFSRNHLPTETLVTLAAGFDEAYALAGELGGMDLDVSENVDGASYQSTINLNAEALSDLDAEAAAAALPDTDAWQVVQLASAAIDPTLSIDATYYLAGGDAVAEIDTADCSKQAYPGYQLLGPAVWLDWASYWGQGDCIVDL